MLVEDFRLYFGDGGAAGAADGFGVVGRAGPALEAGFQHAVELDQVAAQVAGLSLRRLHDERVWSLEEVSAAFSLHTRGEILQRAGAFLENFLSGGSEVLLQDQPLLQLLDEWLCELNEGDFIESLPLFRRSFSDFDAVARKRVMERVARGRHSAVPVAQAGPNTANHSFDRALPLLYQILGIASGAGDHE